MEWTEWESSNGPWILVGLGLVFVIVHDASAFLLRLGGW